MKTDLTITRWLTGLAFSIISLSTSTAFAQGTAFTYQGRLNSSGSPANGLYDFRFKLYSDPLGNTQVGASYLTNAIPVATGLFITTIDFGAGIFSGSNYWLEVDVRTNNAGSYTVLSPLQAVTPTPYAIMANNASNLLGTLPAAQLSAGTANINITGSAAMAVNGVVTTGAYADPGWITSLAGGKITGNIGGNAAGFTGNLAGDVTGPQSATAISSGAVTADKLANDAASLAKVSGGAMANSGGNVGIGKANPATALDVNGTVTATAFSGGGTITWQTVSGTSQQALPNTGYIVNNSAQVTITLPTSPNVGDIVRVSGMGSGGWKLAQNSGQSVLVGNVAAVSVGATWTPQGPSGVWNGVASSADGSKLVAAMWGGQIYTSADSGATWTPHDSSRNWRSPASSADGTKLVALVANGQVYTSADSGLTWAPHGPSTNWSSVASSGDGVKLVAAVYGGQIYTSTDSGTNWTARDSSRNWEQVASSSDGTKLVAVVASANSQIYTSADSGVTWMPHGPSSGFFGVGVASSADGTRLVAPNYVGIYTTNGIYTSTDSGINWTSHGTSTNWDVVASSADGTKLLAARSNANQPFYISTDSGASWATCGPSAFWDGLALSADGTKLVAVAQNVPIYTCKPALTSPSSITTVGAGFLCGGQSA